MYQWGDWSRRLSDGLGYPKYSAIERMIQQQRVFKDQKGDGPVTARGKQPRVFRPAEVDEPPQEIVEIDRLVAKLSGVSQSTVYRAYLYRQPDRIMARELRIPRYAVTARREAAVRYVLDQLKRLGF